MSGRAVFLDRDGVLNRAIVRAGRPYPPATVEALEILPDVRGALLALRGAGFDLIVVTNQPDVGRGVTPRETVDAINGRLLAALTLDVILSCYHDDADDCQCRKPRPGMLLRMRDERGLDMAQSFMVGDRWRDVEAGVNAGCRTVFIDRGYSERRPCDIADHVCGSLGEAAQWIISHNF